MSDPPDQTDEPKGEGPPTMPPPPAPPPPPQDPESQSRLTAAGDVPESPPSFDPALEGSISREITMDLRGRAQAGENAWAGLGPGDAESEGAESIEVDFTEPDAPDASDDAGDVFDEAAPSSSRRTRVEESLEELAFGAGDARESSPRHTPPPESGRQIAPTLEWELAQQAEAEAEVAELPPPTPRRPFTSTATAATGATTTAAAVLTPTTPIGRMPEVRAPVTLAAAEVAAFMGKSPDFSESFGSVLDAALAL